LVGSSKRDRKWRSAISRAVKAHAAAATVEEAVASLAREMLNGVECPPTDLEALCEKSGISLAQSDDLIGSGALMSDGTGLQILYARDLSLARRRFTIAHEFGHATLQKITRGRVSASNELERLCDMFATELLMPKAVFLSEIGSSFRLSEVPALAHRFRVSLTSAAIRVAELTGVSVFEIDKDEVRWGVGLIKRRPLSALHYALSGSITEALNGRSGIDHVGMTIGESFVRCDVEYWPIGKKERALIMLRNSCPSNSVDGP
jgi:predicted transcriptional regulator